MRWLKGIAGKIAVRTNLKRVSQTWTDILGSCKEDWEKNCAALMLPSWTELF
jgi:hypothetical protein